MIVPITCPQKEEKATYTMESISKIYHIKQELDCYVYSDIPERPLHVVAELLPNNPLALFTLIVPPLVIMASLIVCLVTRSSRKDSTAKQEQNSSGADEEQKANLLVKTIDVRESP